MEAKNSLPVLGVTDVTIKVEPDIMLDKATQVSNAALSIQDRLEELVGIVSRTSGYWNGEAADTYREQFSKIETETLEMVDLLHSHATNLQQIAGLYTTTEKTIQTANAELPADAIE